MMAWLAAAFFLAIAVALYAARVPLARGQALVAGGRLGTGCIVAQAIGFLILAVLAIVFRDLLR